MYRFKNQLIKFRRYLHYKTLPIKFRQRYCMVQSLMSRRRLRVRWKYLGVASAFVLAITSAGLVSPAPARASSCDNVQFIFARGSGEGIEGTSYTAWHDSIETAIADMGLQYSFYDLGSQEQSGYQYPAVTVSDGFWGMINLVGAYFSAGSAMAFGHSVEKGIGELSSYIRNVSATCPNTKFVLGGYSQGAMVVMKTLDQLDASKIVYVATFGDPKIYLPEGKNDGIDFFLPTAACQGRNLSPYRAYVPDCHAYRGVLGSIEPYHPEAYAGKVGTWCNKEDIMCSSHANVDDHTAYVSDNLYGDAAIYIKSKLRAAFPPESSGDSSWIESGFQYLHQLAILIDTNGDMFYSLGLYIGAAMRLAERILENGGEVAIYRYTSITERPTELLCDFGCNMDELWAAVTPLRSGGGNAGNSLLSTMRKAMEELDWKPGSTKTLLALTNPYYAYPDLDGTTSEMVVQMGRMLGGVNFYTLSIRGNDKNYEALTSAMGGKSFNSTDHAYEYNGDVLVDTIASIPAIQVATSVIRSLTSYKYTFNASYTARRAGASASFNLLSTASTELTYDWDFDGDGIYDLENTGPVVSHDYDPSFSGYAQVRAHDGEYSSIATILVNPSEISNPDLDYTSTDPTSDPTNISNLQSTQADEHTVHISFDTDAPKVLLALGDAVMGFIEPQDNHVEFDIHDVYGDLDVKLIPYGMDGFRGNSNNVVAHGEGTPPGSDNTDNSGDKNDNTQGGSNNSSNTSSSSSSNFQPILNQINSATHVTSTPGSQEIQFVPKAPNTGTIRRKYYFS